MKLSKYHRPLTRLVGCLLLLVIGVTDVEAQNSATDEPQQVQNVVLIVSDDLRANVLGCYGDRFCKTPNIDRLASRGMLFQRAYCQGTWCAPSRQSFMHSRYQGGGVTNLGEHLIEHGFHSARVGKIYHMRVPGDIIAGTDGLDIASTWTERYNSPGLEAHTPGDYACLNLNIFTRELVGRQSTKMPHRPFVTVQYDGDGSDQPDFKSAVTAVEILKARAQANETQPKPFFLAVGLVRPHYPMVAPRPFFEPYPWEEMQLPETRDDDWEDMPKAAIAGSNSKRTGLDKYPDNQKRMWSGYYASVSFMDAQVGKILDALDELGLSESTAVIFTSDHGYHLGDHDFWQKANLHEQVTRVPLIVSVPGYSPGQSNSLVELVDLYPTITEATGLPTPDSVQGKSLLPVMKDPQHAVRSMAISLNHGGLGLRSPTHAYMRYPNGSEELYNMQADPQQFDNLADEGDSKSTLEEFRNSAQELDRLHDLRVFKKSKK